MLWNLRQQKLWICLIFFGPSLYWQLVLWINLYMNLFAWVCSIATEAIVHVHTISSDTKYLLRVRLQDLQLEESNGLMIRFGGVMGIQAFRHQIV